MRNGILLIVLAIFTFNIKAEILEWKVNMKSTTKESEKVSQATINAKTLNEFYVKQGNMKAKFFVEKYLGGNWDINPKDVKSYLIKAKIYQIKNGVETLISRPEVVTKLGKKAEIIMKSTNGDQFKLDLTPNKL